MNLEKADSTLGFIYWWVLIANLCLLVSTAFTQMINPVSFISLQHVFVYMRKVPESAYFHLISIRGEQFLIPPNSFYYSLE